MATRIEACIGGAWEAIGATLVSAGNTDGSGIRRCAARMLGERDWEGLLNSFGISRDEAEKLREICLQEWGEYRK